MEYSPQEEIESNSFPISDALDAAILMHRDTHFGGKFEFMIEYYEHGGKGVQPEFEISRIKALNHLELRLAQNLAPFLLTGPDAEKIAEAKEAYKKLRNIYSSKKSSTKNYAKLMADLILSEEEEPEAEIAAIAAEKSAIIPFLIDLLRSEEFHDPLFPGYGLAPALAAKCLGRLGDKRSIVALFEAIGSDDFVFEDLALEALREIGEPAKEFLFRVLHAKPINFDNERAATALLQFKSDPDVVKRCFDLLKNLNLKEHSILAAYLVLACEGLTDPSLRKEFLDLAKNPNTPKMLQPDFDVIAKHWQQGRVEI